MTIISGNEFEPVITDDFLLLPLPAQGGAPLTVQFRVAARAGAN